LDPDRRLGEVWAFEERPPVDPEDFIGKPWENIGKPWETIGKP
jgi:hypothetical protein